MNQHQKIYQKFIDHVEYDKDLGLNLINCNFSHLHNHISEDSKSFYISLIHYLASALTVFWKLKIYKKHLSNSDIDWFTYAYTEIEYFFTNIRSALDSFAVIINYNAKKPKQSPESFTKLYNDINNYSPNLVDGSAELIKSFTEYETILLIRDEIIHRGDKLLVFSDHEDGTLFGLIKSSDKLNHQIEQYFYNGKTIDFDKYGSYIFCRAFKLFEEWSTKFYSQNGIKPSGTSRILGVKGLDELEQIIDDVLS